jgi:hypothetical protein
MGEIAALGEDADEVVHAGHSRNFRSRRASLSWRGAGRKKTFSRHKLSISAPQI